MKSLQSVSMFSDLELYRHIIVLMISWYTTYRLTMMENMILYHFLIQLGWISKFKDRNMTCDMPFNHLYSKSL